MRLRKEGGLFFLFWSLLSFNSEAKLKPEQSTSIYYQNKKQEQCSFFFASMDIYDVFFG